MGNLTYRGGPSAAMLSKSTEPNMDDPLDGMHPDPKAKGDYGYNLGAMAARGERGALIVDQDFLMRLPSSFPLDTPVDMSDILLHF